MRQKRARRRGVFAPVRGAVGAAVLGALARLRLASPARFADARPVRVRRVVTHRVRHPRRDLAPAPGDDRPVASDREVASPPIEPEERALVVAVQVAPAPFPILQRRQLRLEQGVATREELHGFGERPPARSLRLNRRLDLPFGHRLLVEALGPGTRLRDASLLPRAFLRVDRSLQPRNLGAFPLRQDAHGVGVALPLLHPPPQHDPVPDVDELLQTHPLGLVPAGSHPGGLFRLLLPRRLRRESPVVDPLGDGPEILRLLSGSFFLATILEDAVAIRRLRASPRRRRHRLPLRREQRLLDDGPRPDVPGPKRAYPAGPLGVPPRALTPVRARQRLVHRRLGVVDERVDDDVVAEQRRERRRARRERGDLLGRRVRRRFERFDVWNK